MAAPDTDRRNTIRMDGPPVSVCPACNEPYWDPEMSHCPHDGTRLEAGGEAGPATRVDLVVGQRYRLLGKIGEGGMGSVFVAEHALSLRRVAMKIIKPELESSKIARQRFLRECHTLERIDSPHVVEVLEAGESPANEIYLVMELLEGRTLGERIQAEGPLPMWEACEIAAQVASALQAAHEVGIVHRDMKPDNVFLCDDGTVRVIDFGIARLLDGQTVEGAGRKLTADGTIVGTPAYISPEQAAGKQVDPRSDLYSLGVVLFEALTGEPPFWDDHPVMLMGLHLKATPPALRDRRSDLPYPPALEALVAGLLRKRPEERPSAARDVEAALRALNLGEHARPSQHGPTTVMSRPPVGMRGPMLVWIALAIGVFLFFGILAIGLIWLLG
ncbi:MAG: serine/threonine-protein kinase [Myxococcota bacterium]|nr:serine/threonine-protein kinase [Myxococcota bacterium]